MTSWKFPQKTNYLNLVFTLLIINNIIIFLINIVTASQFFIVCAVSTHMTI